LYCLFFFDLYGFPTPLIYFETIQWQEEKGKKIRRGVTRKNQRKTDKTMARRKRKKDIKGGNP
jgi:hypothetical protein